MRLSRSFAVSLAGLVALAAGWGFWAGLRAVPPTETEIIEAAAAVYVAQTGGAWTDCYARPSALPAVRLVVICEGPVVWVAAFDHYGGAVEIDPAAILEEPQA